jgi:hypothetical protein
MKELPAQLLKYDFEIMFKYIIDKAFEIAGALMVLSLALVEKQSTIALFTVLTTVFVVFHLVLFLLALGYEGKEIKELIAKMATGIVLAVFGEGWFSFAILHQKDGFAYTVAATILLFLDIFKKGKK